MNKPTPLEQAAIDLHDFLWDNLGVGAAQQVISEWPLQLSGDDETVPHTINLLNKLQEEIKASGFSKKVYQPRQ
jgi:hypothetical protein